MTKPRHKAASRKVEPAEEEAMPEATLGPAATAPIEPSEPSIAMQRAAELITRRQNLEQQLGRVDHMVSPKKYLKKEISYQFKLGNDTGEKGSMTWFSLRARKTQQQARDICYVVQVHCSNSAVKYSNLCIRSSGFIKLGQPRQTTSSSV